MEFYFEERMSILKCLETILSLSQRQSHPYKVSVRTFYFYITRAAGQFGMKYTHYLIEIQNKQIIDNTHDFLIKT